MTCETILNLIVLGGIVLGVSAGVATEVALAKAGYQPKNYLAEWRERLQTRSLKSASNPA